MSLRTRFLEPELVRRLGRAELSARTIVEGFLTGLHNSPYRGFSVEFAEHRAYVPGDDIRHIDWKVYAKRERYYIKQYHEETNFVASLLLDASASMTFCSGGPSKLEYASTASAALAYLVLRQNDAVSLGVFDRESTAYQPPGTGLPFLESVARSLEQVHPTGGTSLGASLGAFARLIARRGIVVVVSDFLDEPASIVRGLQQLAFGGHEVIALHVLDPHEIEFPLEGHVRFEGLESADRILLQPHRIRDAYLAALDEHLHALRQGCSRAGIEYRLAGTAEPLDEMLLTYLAARARQKKGAR